MGTCSYFSFCSQFADGEVVERRGHNGVADTWWFKQQKLIVSQLWRPGV